MVKLRQFHKTDLARNTRIYNLYHEEYGWIDGWNRGSKMDNYERMIHLSKFAKTPLRGKSCLDIGCGTGDFSLFLRKRGTKGYLGVDIYEPSLKKARDKYPQEIFLNADLLAGEVRGKYDFAFCSGALTLKLQSADNYDFLISMASNMWQMTRVGVVFNVLTIDPHPDPDLFFYDPKTVLEICRKIVKNGHVKMIKNRDKHQAHFYLWR